MDRVTRAVRLPAKVRHRQILNEASRIIGERGYFGFTLHELAERCGVTNGAVLHYCGSKELLLIDVLRDMDQRREREIADVFASELSCEERDRPSRDSIRQLLRRIVALNVAQPELLRTVVVLRAEALNPAHPAHGHFAARDAAVQSLVGTMLSAIAPDPAGTAQQLVALMLGLELQWLREGQAFDLVAAWDRAAGTILRHT